MKQDINNLRHRNSKRHNSSQSFNRLKYLSLCFSFSQVGKLPNGLSPTQQSVTTMLNAQTMDSDRTAKGKGKSMKMIRCRIQERMFKLICIRTCLGLSSPIIFQLLSVRYFPAVTDSHKRRQAKKQIHRVKLSVISVDLGLANIFYESFQLCNYI